MCAQNYPSHMSRNYYPAVEIKKSSLDFETAESVSERLKNSSVFTEENYENKYERKTVNGDTEISGYIKLSLDHPDIESDYNPISATYNAKDQELLIHSFLPGSVGSDNFKTVIEVFEEEIVPELQDELGQTVSVSVTTKFT